MTFGEWLFVGACCGVIVGGGLGVKRGLEGLEKVAAEKGTLEQQQALQREAVRMCTKLGGKVTIDRELVPTCEPKLELPPCP